MFKGVQASDLGRLKSITQPVSTGQRCFFVENGVDLETNRYLSRIASVDKDGRYRVWAGDGINVCPVVFNRTLYYLHRGAHGSQLMHRSLSSGPERAVKVHGSVSQLIRRGLRLYFKLTYDRETPKFKTTRFPRVRRIKKLFNKRDEFGWLPNHASYALAFLNLKTRQVKVVFRSHFDLNLQSVSPDCRKILYLQAVMHDPNQVNRARGVFEFDVRDHHRTLVNRAVPRGVFHTASFSPDGKKIALIGNDNRYPSATVNDLWLYDRSTRQLNNLTRRDDTLDAGYAGGLSTDFAQQRSNVELRWLDDRHCLFHAYHHAHSQLYVCDGHRIRLVSDAPREVYDFNVVDPRTVILSSSKQTQPCELRRLNLKTGREVTLYNPNRAYERTHRYADVDAFTYLSSDHRVTLHGWVMHSLKKNQSRSPVLLYVHGGPHDAYGESFFHEFQVLASHGYSLVYVNPRGSTTYGQRFEATVIGHFGQKDYADVMSGLTAALHRFSDLDRRRVFIMGGSYGGFMTLWAIGHTNRFHGAIAQRPLADWPLVYGTGDIGVRFAQDELGCDLYRDHALRFYWQQSPIASAMNVRTPLLLQHGEYDMRCPVSQSEAYFTAVRQVDLDVTYLRYPQGYHGVSRHGLPSLRVQRIKDILTWLNRHLN